MGWPLVTSPRLLAQEGAAKFAFARTSPVGGEVTRNSMRGCYNPSPLMLTAIAVTICVSATITIWRITKVRRTRTANKAMRDYVRRAY
jgi:hypothetical protein